MNDVLLVLTSVPDVATAERLALAVVSEHLAACASIVPGLKSFFYWKGDLCREDELLLIAKTTRNGSAALQKRLIELHPYELAEIIELPVSGGSKAYLDWVERAVDPG